MKVSDSRRRVKTTSVDTRPMDINTAIRSHGMSTVEKRVKYMVKSSQHVEKLSKFLMYVLGRRPDEFGLVPDADGFVGLKVLLQALHEEPGWRHIRMAHLNEALITPQKPVVEILNNRIRAIDTTQLPLICKPDVHPKLLYLAIRSRSYQSVLEKGMSANHYPHLVLSVDIAMANRMGRRLDNAPTLLTVQVAESREKGTTFQQYGRLLFLADAIFPGTFSGPALPKTNPDANASSPTAKPVQAKTPGSYFPDPNNTQEPKQRHLSGGRRREPDWKKARRQERRHKAELNKP